MKLVTSKIRNFFLKNAFHLLYHSMAFTYDWVAAIASAGKWETWIRTAIPYINGPKVLELGFGPGHLQVDLLKQNILAFGIDESRQMSSIASRNIRRQAGPDQRLVRGKVQFLPFATETFNTIISTFPSPYIFDPLTINEITRVLAPSGKVIIVLGAAVTGERMEERLSAWIMDVTHQSLNGQESIQEPSFGLNLNMKIIHVELKSSQVVLIEVIKPPGPIYKEGWQA